MEYNKYTIRDYDRYLDYCSGILNRGKQILEENRMDESKGIVDDYRYIAEELFEALINVEPIPFNNETAYLLYNLRNYKMQQDCFLDTINIRVYTRSNDNSSFNGGNIELLKDNLKLSNILFDISITEKFLDSGNGKNEFILMMAHELQHVYRFYCIMLTNQSYVDQENRRLRRYQNSLNRENKKSIEEKILDAYYRSEKDEISSETNKLYEFIRQNEKIGEWNYDAYEKDFPLYTILKSLESTLETIESHREDIELMEYIGSVYKRIINDDNQITDRKAAMKFRTRIIYALMFAKRNYKRTLAKAFADFNRYIVKEHRNALKTIINWDKIDEEFKQIRNRDKMLNNNVL